MSTTQLERDWYRGLIEDLVAARKQQRVSQEALSDRIGVSDTMVAKWENGHRLPTAYWLMCWCQALGVRIKVD